MEKAQLELASLFSVEKVHVLHPESLLLSVYLSTIAISQSACRNFDSYCKMLKGVSF